MQQERDPAVGQDRHRGPAEDLLQPHGQHRLVWGVVDPHARPAGHLDTFGGQVVEPAGLRPRHHRPQGGRHVDATEVLRRADPCQLRPQPGVQALRQCCVAHVGPRVAERAVQEVEAGAQRRGGLGPVEEGDPLARDRAPDRVAHGLRGRVAERDRAQLDGAQQRPPASEHPPTGPGDLVHLGPQRSGSLQREVLGEGRRRADLRLALSGPSLGVTDREPLQPGERTGVARVERRAGPGRHQVGRARGAGPLAGDPVRVRQRDHQTHRHVVGEGAGIARRRWPVALLRHDLVQPGDLAAPRPRPPVGAQRPEGRDQVPARSAYVLAQHRDHLRGPLRPDETGPVDQCPRQPGIDRDARDHPAPRGDAPVLGHRPQAHQHLRGRRQGVRRRLVEQRQVADVLAAPARDLQGEGRQVGGGDLGLRMCGQVRVLRLGPAPQHGARPEPSGPSCPLLGGRPAHRDGDQGGEPAAVVGARLTGEPGIHHDAHPGHRQRRLGDRGRDDHAPTRTLAERTVLLGAGQTPVQGVHGRVHAGQAA